MAKGLNDTSSALLNSIATNEEEVSPSTIFAVASILEGVSMPLLMAKDTLVHQHVSAQCQTYWAIGVIYCYVQILHMIGML